MNSLSSHVHTLGRVIGRRASCAALILGASLISTASVSAQSVPNYWPYQGFILDQSGQPVEGSVNLSVGVYADLFSATPLWRGDVANVSVTNGAFAVDLGESGGEQLAALIRSGEARYIGVSVNGGVELSPRTRLGSVPYATVAGDAFTLGGRSPDEFVTVVNLGEQLEGVLPDFDAINTEIATVRGIAEGAQAAADQANTAAQTAQNTADQANTAAQTAQNTANQANTAAQTAQNTANTNTAGLATAADDRQAIRDLAEAALSEAAIRTLIESYGYITTAGATVLINQLFTQAIESDAVIEQINQLIDARGYVNADAITVLINQNVDARGYLNNASATTLINNLIDARSYLNEDAATTLINNLIDARGYVTEARAQEIADERAAALVAASEARLNNTINALVDRINALETSQGVQDGLISALETSQGVQDGQIADLDTRVTTAQTTADAASAAAAQGQSSSAFILGLSSHQSNGWFRFSRNGVDYQGVRAAGEACKATYSNEPNAHFCSLSEVQQALSVGNYNAAINDRDTWVFPSWSKANGGFDGDNDFCQSMLYNSGHAADGTSVAVLVNSGSTTNGVGDRLAFNDSKACNQSLPVLCCR